MTQIVCVHSFRGGTGKSNITANLAALLARRGKRVAIVDTDIQSPGVHVLFGIDEKSMQHSLNEFLWGECEITDAAQDVTALVGDGTAGRLFMIPASLRAGDIARVLHDGYDVSQLQNGFEVLVDRLALDVLFIDTHPGLNEETLLSVALSDVMLVLLRPDQQDYQGTAVTLQVARRLDIPCMLLVLNKLSHSLDAAALSNRIEGIYGCKVAGALPHSDDLMLLGSSGLFVVRFPDHPLTAALGRIADAFVEAG